MTSMNVMITGASGFLGGTISRTIKAQCERLVVCVRPDDRAAKTYSDRRCSFRLPDQRFARVVAEEKPEWLIHCAGSASVRASFADPDADRRGNVDVTEFVFRTLARHSPATRVINLSSAAVYGQPASLPITLETPANPVSPYGIHKRECEWIAQQYGDQNGIQSINLRIFSSYGPGLQKQVLWDIYNKAMAGPTVSLFGDGTETRDFIYSRDVALLVTRLINHPRSADAPITRCLNLASGKSVQIRELASLFLEKIGSRAELRFTGEHAVGDPRHWAVDTTPLAEFGFHPPPTSLNQGLAIYARWIRSLTGNADADRILAAAG